MKIIDKATRFQKLHLANDIFVMANAWSAGSAILLEEAGIKAIGTIKALIQEVDGPVNVVMGLSGPPISVTELKNAGVTRISIGGSLARAALGLVRRAAREMLDCGTFEYSKQQIADDELCKLFSNHKIEEYT